MLAACASTTNPWGPTYSTAPTYTAPAASYPVAGTEYGRILNLEYLPAGTRTGNNQSVLGAVVGGVAGALLGSQIGGRLAGRIPPAALRRGFGVFVVVMAIFILAKELL